MIKLAFYAILGLVLAACGISIIDEPLKFLAILLNVMAIDFASMR